MDPILIIATLAKIGFIMFLLLNLGGLMTWVERKQSAVMQDRIGANRASIFGIKILGLFHPIADAIKMLTKEDFVPAGALKPLHGLAPIGDSKPDWAIFELLGKALASGRAREAVS